LWIACIS
jgi:hypothetical protein